MEWQQMCGRQCHIAEKQRYGCDDGAETLSFPGWHSMDISDDMSAGSPSICAAPCDVRVIRRLEARNVSIRAFLPR